MNVTGENLDQLLASATKNGMYLVDDSNTDALEKEYDEETIVVDKLCEIVDPETTPFESKYKARTILDTLCNKLEATRTIASLEKKRDVMERMSRKIASARVRLGTISWECEEPHNAQTDLELAAEHYFSGFVARASDLIGSDAEDVGSGDGFEDPKMRALKTEELSPPTIEMEINDETIDAMKCLNMLGILWAGRGQVRKSLLYLLSVKKLYHSASENEYLSKGVRKTELDSIYTHNLFYLAQAYGNIQDSQKSSEYCRETLQRQFDAGLDDTKVAYDWVRNCSSIADFYYSMEKHNSCALALASAEKILTEKVFSKIKIAENAEIFNVGLEDCVELEAEINKKWAKLDVKIMRTAFDIQAAKKHALESGEHWEDPVICDDNDGIEQSTSGIVCAIDVDGSGDEIKNTKTNLSGELKIDQDNATSAIHCAAQKSSFIFVGCPVQSVTLLRLGEISNFESARIVFLRASARIEEAKKKYLLEGFVTDHVTLLQEQSKLYHYLAAFEIDSKRKIAMEKRRIELLLPLLSTLNRVAFDNLHKQISYELGEAYLCLLDIKLDKLREKAGGGVDEKKLKKNEIEKCNSYCKGMLAMFAHFTNMYAGAGQKLDGTYKINDFEKCSVKQLSAAACISPDESLISGEEVRPFLNAHFMCCRALSKVIVSQEEKHTKIERAEHLVASLNRYAWLAKFGGPFCERKGCDIADVFGEEIKICSDMVELLPSKIDRMHYGGESGLSI